MLLWGICKSRPPKDLSEMNMNRGIFENFPNPPVDKKDSPFAIAPESAETAAAGSPFTAVSSPFSAGGTQGSPFSVGDEKKDGFEAQEYKEISKKDSLFQVAEPSEGFGFEAPVTTADTAPGPSPFKAVSGAGAPATASFTTAEKTISEDAAMTAAESDSFGDPKCD